MTPDNYKQSFTDDFKQEESCKILKKKKVFEIRQKKSCYSTKSSI